MEYVVTFEHGEVISEYPQCLSYGLKHKNRFGELRDIRQATEEDPFDEYRLIYRLFASSPAYQRYLRRKYEKKHPGQPPLFPLWDEKKAKGVHVRKTRGRRPLGPPPQIKEERNAEN